MACSAVTELESQASEPITPSPVSSCRKKKSEDASFLENVKNHIDEFVNASMYEHKTCFKKPIQKMLEMSKVVAERNAMAKEAESSLSLQTQVSD